MMDYVISIKETIEISKEDRHELIKLKQQYWPYNEVLQSEWFDKNIRSNDYHILIWNKSKLLAYLNMVNIIVELGDMRVGMLGIGNVCVDNENVKTGMGSVIIGIANHFIKANKMCGILLCKDNLVKFYNKNQWVLIEPKKKKVNNNEFFHNIMVYDPYGLYFSRSMSDIYIDRDF